VEAAGWNDKRRLAAAAAAAAAEEDWTIILDADNRIVIAMEVVVINLFDVVDGPCLILNDDSEKE